MDGIFVGAGEGGQPEPTPATHQPKGHLGMAALVITHTHADGTRLTGSRKGDGVYDIVERHGFTWRRSVGILILGSRDKDAQTHKISPAVDALRAAGHEVTVEIDNQWRPAAERATDRAARVDARVDLYTGRADAAAARSTARRDAARRITDGIPFGQPVQPPGHHSRNAHLRALDRADGHRRRQFEEADKARRVADRAAGAAASERHKNDPRAMMRKIETLEAEGRGIARQMEGYTRTFRNGRGEIHSVETHEPASGEWAERLQRRAEMIAEEVAWLRDRLAELQAAGRFVAWSPDDFRKGDQVRVGGRWHTVRRVNRKSVSVPHIVHTMAAGDESPHNDTVTWDRVSGRRRDGMQWDTPDGEPWPVELADKVARWRDLLHLSTLAHQHAWDSPERRRADHVAWAQRLVHGLPLTAADAEVKAITDSIPGVEDRRELVAAYGAVYDRLTAGERVPDIADTLTPVTGEPAWKLPTDREPVDRKPTDLQPGDLVAGVWDIGLAGSRSMLLRHFCGPVAQVSDVLDRREAGEWVTVTLTTGAEREMMTHRWLSVYLADSSTSEAAPVFPADPEFGRDAGAALREAAHTWPETDATVPRADVVRSLTDAAERYRATRAGDAFREAARILGEDTLDMTWRQVRRWLLAYAADKHQPATAQTPPESATDETATGAATPVADAKPAPVPEWTPTTAPETYNADDLRAG